MRTLRALVLAAGLLLAGGPAHAATAEEKIEALTRRLEQVEARVTAQEDLWAIRRLAFSYGYYMDNALYDEVRALFSPNIESCEVSGYGLYKGLDGCNRLWGTVVGTSYGGDKAKLAFGKLTKHYLIKDVVTMSPDGRRATGRFDYMSVSGTFRDPSRTYHQVGIYNFDFVKEGGVWRIGKFWLVFDTINYNFSDWANNPGIRCPKPEAPPDGPGTPYHPFPENFIVPFQWNNPVTGKPIRKDVSDTRYWIGNGPGEFRGPCGRREDAARR